MKRLVYLLLTFVTTVVTLVSCSKDTVSSPELVKKTAVSTGWRSSEGVVSPTCEDGVLWFVDDDHVEAYYNYLDSVEETWSEDGFFQKNDSQFIGFTSLRSLFDNASSLEDPFDKDEVYMSMQNQNAEIGIGDYLYFERIGERYRVKKDDLVSIAAVRSIPKEELLPDDIILNNNVEIVFSNSQRAFVKSANWPTAGPPTTTNRGDCSASAKIYVSEEPCHGNKREATVKIFFNSADDPASKEYGVLISWGDGSFTDAPSGNFGVSIFTHEYALDDVYNIRVQVWGRGSCAGQIILDESKEVEIWSCGRKEVQVMGEDELGGWKLEVKFWTELYKKGNGDYKEKVKAKACTFYNGKKKRKRKELGVDAVWRNNNCNEIDTQAKGKSKKKKCIRVKRKCINPGWIGHKYGDLTAWSRLDYSDACRVDLTLDTCP